MTRDPRQQRGIALVTAVLVVALAVIAATAILESGHLSIQRSATLQDSEKAWWYAAGVEDWVRTGLQRDAEESQIDSLSEAWARPVDFLPVEQGFLRGQLLDQQGRFNLNNLGIADQAKFQIYAAQFERLLSAIPDVDPFIAKPLAQAIRDWIDKDQEPTIPDGVEDTEYQILDPPYRAANQPMQSVTELLAVKGMTRELYGRLRNYVTALPQIPSPINVNTAPEPVMRALVTRPGPEFEAFLRDRLEKPADSVSELTSKGIISAEDAPNDMLSVSSRFFLLQAEATVGNGRVALYSLIFRPSSGAPQVLYHSTDTD
jgi:general secretion pathway protein K